MSSIAHIRHHDRKIQTVEEHLQNVKFRAERIGEKIGVKHIAGLAGVLHDMGKFSEKFKSYILEATNHPEAPPQRGSVDHSTAGGKFLYRFAQNGPRDQHIYMIAEVVANAVISHHAYLHDYLNPDLESPYLNRVRDKHLDDFDYIVQQFYLHVMSEQETQQYISLAVAEMKRYLSEVSIESIESKMLFLTKYVFSALIDADRTDTRSFEEWSVSDPYTEYNAEEGRLARRTLFENYYEKLLSHINKLAEGVDTQSSINQLRRSMSDQCDRYAERPSGIYTLSIPTGGGKTLASLRYALKHAIQHNKKQIIFIVPYTTIIEQNAEEVRRILSDESNILEHHSNVIDHLEDEVEEEWEDGLVVTTKQKLKLARENWDIPIVFTTMVQFLDVFYAKGSRDIRKLHSLSQSVIIFDEVQKVPIHCISLFNHALNCLKSVGQSSIVLCTATQPALQYVKRQLDISPDAEIISNLEEINRVFKRVEIVDLVSEGALNTAQLILFLADKLKANNSVLVVLNTKDVAKRLYREALSLLVPVYHLSTSMCAAHRKVILDQIRDHLDQRMPVICISTQLIEAGVDISFDCVIRSLAGLDSIAQAAGRCNRHGKSDVRPVYVIDHSEENLDRLPEIALGKRLAQQLFIDMKLNANYYNRNIMSNQAIGVYFKRFYTELQTKLDYFIPQLQQNMTDLLLASKSTSYIYRDYRKYKERSEGPLQLLNINSCRTAAKYFQVIDSPTTSVIAPYGDGGKEIIARLNGVESITGLTRLLRQAQRYTVNLYEHEVRRLEQNGGVVSIEGCDVLVLQESAYSKEYGVNLENNEDLDLYIL